MVRGYLESILNQNYKNFKVVLIYNNNDFAYFQKLKKIAKKYSKVILINNNKNLGFAAASNIGIKYALKKGAKYSLLLNDDVQVNKNLIKKLLKPFKKPKMGMVSPIILQASKRIWYAGGMISRFFAFTRNFYIGKKYNSKIKSGPTNVISGCCVLARNIVWQKIGYLDEDLFMYFDDPDISLRAQKNGFICYLVAEPLVVHLKTSTRLNSAEAYYYARNPFILINKHYKGINKITAYLGQFTIRFPRNLIRLQNKKSLSSYLRGIGDGIRRIR